MAAARTVRLVRPGRPTREGAGVHLCRAFGFDADELFDPFLLLDDFRATDPATYAPGFPWHPHRGIETITYVVTGTVEHGDSLGNQGVIGPGDVQWMTAGSGIIHQEMPRGDHRGHMGGFQLWANLPAAHKMTEPRYCGILAAQVPVQEAPGARVRVICGRVGAAVGPARGVAIDPEYLDVELEPGTRWEHPTPPGHTAIAYLFGGSAALSPGRDLTDAANGMLALFDDGESVAATAGPSGARFLLIGGKPLREPVAWRGPIVMNTPEQLDQAWRELADGTFVKHGAAGGRP